MKNIYKNFYVTDLENAIEGTPVKHAIFVQCLNASVEEVDWIIDMARTHSIIKGIVAGLDIISPKLEEVIAKLKPSGLLKGVRHLFSWEKEEDWFTREDVGVGLDILGKHNIPFDLQASPQHLRYIRDTVPKHPKTNFIVDHIAVPPINTGDMETWRQDMADVAKLPNVYCKVSGIISGQTPSTWKTIDFQPIIDHVLSIFGPERCIYGSDWPVFGMAEASYKEYLALMQNLVSKLNEADQRKFFRENAIKFYNLDI
ncbi:uncharacterized protein y4mH-like isoform X2 [Mercenaria mercenaria]|nr:uncharacterized protein y4mH-like isoform X2 [Mercenaria mercenaria]